MFSFLWSFAAMCPIVFAFDTIVFVVESFITDPTVLFVIKDLLDLSVVE